MRHVPHCSCPLTHSSSPAWMDVSRSLICVFRHPDEHLLAEGARSGPRQDVKGIEDLDGIAPRWATTGSADQTTNFEGSPVTNADRRSVNMIWVGGEDSSASSRLECRKSTRFEIGSAGSTSMAGWLGGSCLALQLVWITGSCAPGFACSWPRASCRQVGRWPIRFFPARSSE
jgi:hypothetical protein